MAHSLQVKIQEEEALIDEGDEADEASRKILKHLAENDEQGTLEGIVAWWLLQEEMKKAALLKATELIQENLLLERQAAIARDASK